MYTAKYMTAAKDIMRHDNLITASPNEKVIDVVKKMHENKVGSVLVVDNGKLVGIFTERDLVRIVAEGGALDQPVGNVMSRNLIVVNPEDSIALVASKMIENWIRHIPVVDKEGKPVGIISIRDVLRHIVASSTFP